MNCEDIRESVEEAGWEEHSLPVREHLAHCPSCKAYARDWRLLGSGFRALATEQLPEASPGFSTRVMRRLEEAVRQSNVEAQFFERVGRRVVYATCLVALTMLGVLTLPSSGPLRTSASADLLLAQPVEITAESNPIFPEEFSENPGLPQAQMKTGVLKRHR